MGNQYKREVMHCTCGCKELTKEQEYYIRRHAREALDLLEARSKIDPYHNNTAIRRRRQKNANKPQDQD